MITAVDTSVLIDVFGNDPVHGHTSAESLRKCLAEGTLTACDLVWAETRAVFPDEAAFESAMNTLGVHFSPVPAGKPIAKPVETAAESWRIS
jgi:predicted nucleic acid-binding protein